MKTSLSKSTRICIFPKVHGLGRKFEIWNLKFEIFLLSKIHQEKVFGHVLLRKQVFSDDRNMDLKKRKIAIFARG